MSSSTQSVNFSLRQNKYVERSLVFEHVQRSLVKLDISRPAYIGLGSVWFADFHIAHRQLGVETLVSIEADDDVFRRAQFNRPYACVDVRSGHAVDVIEALLQEPMLVSRPWMVWLDYDRSLDEDRRDELFQLVDELPGDSFLIATASATEGRYGSPGNREARLRQLLGDAVVETVDYDACQPPRLSMTLASSVLRALQTRAVQAGRPTGFVPAFCVPYRDGVPMFTVGGFLPGSNETAAIFKSLVMQTDWLCLLDVEISIPPLTNREIEALRARLPATGGIPEAESRQLGIAISQKDLDAFARLYRHFPTFGQVVA